MRYEELSHFEELKNAGIVNHSISRLCLHDKITENVETMTAFGRKSSLANTLCRLSYTFLEI